MTGFLCSFFIAAASAAPLGMVEDDALPAIAIIIDDLGDNLERGLRAIELPGPVTYSFLPYSPHSKTLAEFAHQRHKEVMLHLPMEPMEPRRLAAGTLRLNMTEKELQRMVKRDLAAVPHAIGVNNHMGSLLTRHPGHMLWLMHEIRARGLYFVDSMTTAASVARQIAVENNVPNLKRDVFLDHHSDYASINRQFRRLIRLARVNGVAVGIGHPHTQTFDVLEEWLPQLHRQGVRLLPVSALTNRQGKISTWQASLSLSPPDLKNSKR